VREPEGLSLRTVATATHSTAKEAPLGEQAALGDAHANKR